MTMKRYSAQLYLVLSLATLTMSFTLLDSQVFGATLKPLTDEGIPVSGGYISENESAQQLAGDNLSLLSNAANAINANSQFSILAQSQTGQTNRSLSWESVLNSFSGLRFEGNNPANGGGNVPILPQTEFSDIFTGVYGFQPTVSNSQGNQGGNANVPRTDFFGEPFSAFRGQGLSNFGIGIQPIGGARTSSNTPSLSRPLAPVSLPSAGGAAQGGVSTLRVPQINGEFAMMPQNDSSGLLQGLNSDSLTQLLNVLNSFGSLEFDVNLPQLPQQVLSTTSTLSDDSFKTSDIVRQNINFESSLSPTLKQQQQQQQQTSQQRQQQQQSQVDQQIQQARQKEQENRLKLEQKYKEQLEKLIEKQQQQQQRFKQQLEEQLRKQQQQQEQLRQSLNK